MSYEYDGYLIKHKQNVRQGFLWLKENLPELIPDNLYATIEHLLNKHDATKTTMEEYEAYDEYFYGKNRSFQVINDFNKAWLHHIHYNPHHWQHWVLLEDDPDGGNVCIEMPYEYVIDMICDWWSFSWSTGNLYEIFNWYEDHKKTMQLHKNTRKLVEDILSQIKNKLDEGAADQDVA